MATGRRFRARNVFADMTREYSAAVPDMAWRWPGSECCGVEGDGHGDAKWGVPEFLAPVYVLTGGELHLGLTL